MSADSTVTVVRSVQISEQIDERLVREAKQKNVSVDEVIRAALKAKFENLVSSREAENGKQAKNGTVVE